MVTNSRSAHFRNILCIVPVAALMLLAAGCRKQASLTVVSFGGEYQNAQRTAYMVPFSQSTGIKITEGEYNGEYGLLAARATAPTPSWDVVSVESGPCMRGGEEGIFATLPDSVFGSVNLVPGAKRPYAAGHLVFSTILAFRQGQFQSGAIPDNWKDFWDLKKFPGKRGLRNNPRGTLEIALLADGVSPDHLYPLDVQRAFRKLDEIKSQLVFWDSGAQPIQLLANKTVVMTSAYNGRLWDAWAHDHLPIGWSFNQGLMETEFWAVPKNSTHKDEAFRFIAFSLDAERQAAFVNSTAYGPTNLSALPLVHADVMSAIPSSKTILPTQVPVNPDWWAQNESRVSVLWDQWRQGH